MANNPEIIKELAQPFLEPGELVLGAMTAQPKGRTTAMAGGGAASMIGQAMTGKVASNAKAVGLVVSASMAVVITQKRLITAKIKISAMGAVTEVKEVMSSLPISEIDSVTAKRLGLGGILSITANGGDPVKLECRVGPARELVEAFEKAKAS
jgi:hypothetical protein